MCRPQTILRGFALVFMVLTLATLLASLGGCAHLPGSASNIVAQQTPGQSTGAGATLTGPANSAAASTQVATRRSAYYPPQREPLPRYAPAAPAVSLASLPSAPTAAEPAGVVVPAPAAQLPPLPAPYWIEEHSETTLGQHQDAAGLVKAATALGSWGRARWLGLMCILFSAFALAWAHNNPDGYPLIAWKIGAVGIFLALFDPSPWWLLLLLIPAALYVVQKLNLTASLK